MCKGIDSSAREDIQLSALSQLQTPFFIFDEARFTGNVLRFKAALLSYHSRIIIGYSVKTNYTPEICRIARNLGCFAEVVSRMELELAKRLEFPVGEVIFNGPFKTAPDMQLAIELGAFIHLDSLHQVATFLELPKTVRAHAKPGLRLNVDLSAGLKDENKIASGGIVPRFGMPIDDLSKAVEQLRAEGIEACSVHGHSSSSDRNPRNYTLISEALLEICKAHALNAVELFDVGGGFSGTLPEIWGAENQPSYEDYARAIFAPLKGDRWFEAMNPTLGIEPGMGILADAMSYVTEVVAVKEIMGRKLASVDGNYFDIRPTLHKKSLPARLLLFSEPEYQCNYIVAGATCMERDILLDNFVSPRPLTRGDRIVIGNLGAYTLVLSPHFINYAPAVYMKRSDGTLDEIRRRQTFDDFFRPYVI